MSNSSPARRGWYWTGWDALTAVMVGIVTAIVSVFHQEAWWVCMLSGLITAVIIFFIVPIGRLLRKDQG